MAPYAILEDPFAFLVLVSALSAHTGDMLANPSVALMIVEPETAAKAPHALARVSVQARARPIAKADPGYAAARASYIGRFADMAGLFELGDFTLVAIDPAAVRVVAGFARAATITPASLRSAYRK